MIIPVTVRHDSESVAILSLWLECPYVHLNRSYFYLFLQYFMWYNYPICLIFGILIPRTKKYNIKTKQLFKQVIKRKVRPLNNILYFNGIIIIINMTFFSIYGKLSLYDAIHDFSVLVITGSNPADVIRFRRHTF